jgi:MarR family 2-MHQ and catechol resistance regulon transcriptional repressor
MPTRYPGTVTETAALDTYIKLMRAVEAVTARVGGVMTGAGLTIGQFGVLEALLHHGPLCQRDLGQKLLRSDGNTAVVVANLVRRGLVAQARRLDDRRFVTVSLTGRGRRLIDAIFPVTWPASCARWADWVRRSCTRLAASAGGSASAATRR